MKAGWIKKHCAFLDETEYTKGSDYRTFYESLLLNYKREGDNAHDDAPDGMHHSCRVCRVNRIKIQRVIHAK